MLGRRAEHFFEQSRMNRIKITASIRRFIDKFGDFSSGCLMNDIKTRRNVRAWYMRRGRIGI
jgi:hypothetical protein